MTNVRTEGPGKGLERLAPAAFEGLARRFGVLVRELASAPGGRTGWRLVIEAERGELRLLRVEAGGTREIGRLTLAALENQPSELRRLLAGQGSPGKTTLRLAASRAVTVTLELPATTPANLAAILRNKIDRVAPWPAAEAVHGYDQRPAREPGKLDVTLAIASRSDLSALLAGLAAAGLAPDAIDVAGADPAAEPVLIEEHVPERLLRRARALTWTYSVAAGVLAATCLGLLALNVYDASHVADLRASLASDGAASPSSTVTLESMLERKTAEPTALGVLTHLSTALPDSVWVASLSLTGSALAIRGQGREIPGAIEALQKDAMFEGVRFTAPTVRRQEDQAEEFAIAVEIRPDKAGVSP